MFHNDDGSNGEPKTWVVLAAAILPLAVAAITDRVGSEISAYFKRRRLAKKKAEAEAEAKAKKEVRKAAKKDKAPKELPDGEHKPKDGD